MKNTCLVTTLVLLVIITVCSAAYDQEDVTNYLNWYRASHGAGKLKNGLEYSAFEATNAVCKYGLGHHKGTEAEFASLYYGPYPCESDQEASEIAALKYWYSECSDYYGQGFDQDTGHFTHLVWKSSKTYGIWAQTCDIPGGQYKCAIAFKSDGQANLQGGFNSNVGNVGQCANVERPWARSLYSLAPKVSSPVSPYIYGLNPFINNQQLFSAFPYLYSNQSPPNVPRVPASADCPWCRGGVKPTAAPVALEGYVAPPSAPSPFRPPPVAPTAAPVAPEGYVGPKNEGAEQQFASATASGCLNFKGESVPCNYSGK